MKLMYFGGTCLASSFAAGLISGQSLTGFCVGFALWWLLMSLDAIANPAAPTEQPRGGVVHGDCDL